MQPTPAQWDSGTTPKTLHAFVALTFLVEDALQSTIPHSVFHSLKCVVEHLDTSMATQMHSITGSLSTHITLMDCLWPMVLQGTTSGPLRLGIPRTVTAPAATAPVPPPILVELHLHSWERSFSASLGTPDHMKPSGTLMTLCGTRRGVQQIAPAVIVVVRGSLPHWARKLAMTLKWGGAQAQVLKEVAWNSWRYTSTSTQAEEEVVCRLSNTIL